MADEKSIGGAFEALTDEVLHLVSLVQGFEEVARQVAGEDAHLPGWLCTLRRVADRCLAANDALQPHVWRRTARGRAARKLLATLPRRSDAAPPETH
jgi:hypothetical protein